MLFHVPILVLAISQVASPATAVPLLHTLDHSPAHLEQRGPFWEKFKALFKFRSSPKTSSSKATSLLTEEARRGSSALHGSTPPLREAVPLGETGGGGAEAIPLLEMARGRPISDAGAIDDAVGSVLSHGELPPPPARIHETPPVDTVGSGPIPSHDELPINEVPAVVSPGGNKAGVSKKVVVGGLAAAAVGGGIVGGGIVYGVEENRHRPAATSRTATLATNLTDAQEKDLIAWAEAQPNDEQWIINYINQLTDVDQARKDRIIAAVRAAAAKSSTNVPRVASEPLKSVASVENIDGSPSGGGPSILAAGVEVDVD